MKKKKNVLIIPVIILIASGLFLLNKKESTIVWPQNDTTKKVVVLGFDGAEHTLLEKWVGEGKLPNIKKLMGKGTYSPLETSIPAQSPVAWSSFATGENPGKHDVMDFIIRDPATYAPAIGMADVKQKTFGKPEITSKQQGKTFWQILSEKGIKSKIIKVPITFPAEALDGELLTGLGTPDALGTIGTFSYYTTQKTDYIDNDQAYNLKTLENKNVLETNIQGPKKFTEKLVIERNEESVDLTVGSKKINLKVGAWTDYINIDFDLLGPFVKEHGIAKFYLEESKPNLKLYLSPIGLDPDKPFYNISYPTDFSALLSGSVGKYKTVGWSDDTWALKEERISEDVFLQDLNSTLDEEIKIFKSEIAKNDWNVYVQVFQATDYVQHMFWRYMDPKNPRYEDNPKYKDTILKVYERMDQIIGEVERIMPEDTTLIVMSDHGFSAYNKSVDLNAWLVDNGYMTLKDPSKRSDWLKNVYKGEVFWDNVDWSKTKAYGLGLGSLYINLKDREGQGIVSEEEYSNIRNEIREKLLGLVDNGEKVVSNIYKREDIMHGQYLSDAADLIVGFTKGYRVSWQTTFGSVPKQVIFDNNNKWSGDHCSVDPILIPGIFISNEKLGTQKTKNIMDVAPTILSLYDVQIPLDMDGEKF